MKKWLGVIGALLVAVLPAGAADLDGLMKKMKDKDTDLRRQAAQELSELGPEAKEALPLLIQGLKDSDLFVRRFSAKAIGKIGPEASSALTALRSVALNPKETKEVQEAAIAALGKLGKGSVDVLVSTLKDKGKENDVRRKAIESLGDMGADARSALDTLVEALKGETMPKKGTTNSGDMRIEVVTAIGQIANSKDDAAIKAIEAIAAAKGKNKALKSAATDALKQIKKRD